MSTISASTTSTTAYKVTADTTGVLTLQTGATPTTAMTIDGSQNVGVGVVPSPWTIFKAIEVGGNGAGIAGGTGQPVIFCNATYNSGWKYTATGVATNYDQTAGAHRWFNAVSGTAGNAITFTQAMTLDASGSLLVGTSSAGGGKVESKSGVSSSECYRSWNASDSGTRYFHYFGVGSASFTQVGSVTSTGSTTAYNTTSDYRLKENVVPMTGALAKVAALKPVTYTWKVDGSVGEGFIAHELAEVFPDAVTGEKDAIETYTDAEGNEQTRPVYQGIDVSFLVGTLTAAIQELKAELDAAKVDIATLKGAA